MALRYNHFYINKADGSKRLISSPTSELKQKSYQALESIDAKLRGVRFYEVYTPFLHSYIKNRGCASLVNEITGFISDGAPYDIVYMDVVDYFGSIHLAQWMQAVLVLNVNFGQDFISYEDARNIWACAVQTEGSHKGIAQGNPLSPMISNIVGWYGIDKYLSPDRSGLLKLGYDCRYWRYSDNIFLVAKRTAGYSREDLLRRLHMEMHYELSRLFKVKVKVKSSNQTNIALGIRIGKRAQLKDKKWLRSVFHRYGTKGDRLAEDQDIIKEYGILDREKTRQLVQGLAAYALDIDPTMRLYINNKLGATRDGDQGHQAVQQEGTQEG